MFKTIAANVWLFDLEWAPNPAAGRAAYGLPANMADALVVEEMYRRGGATPENPRPFLKTVLCQIVAIAAVKRHRGADGVVALELKSLPAIGARMDERQIVDAFLSSVGKVRPQLAGFNIGEADIPMLLQRAVAHELHQPQFCARPDKPWLGLDYFAGKHGDGVLDLKNLLGGFGKAAPSLHEICVSSGIPGKLDTGGADVADLWLAGDVDTIVRYAQTDVLSEYDLLLRALYLAGSITSEQYKAEQDAFATMLGNLIGLDNQEAPKQGHLLRWLEARKQLRDLLTRKPQPAVPQLELVAP
jgi:predicted PolB exonuclease-like 3'-5' exonuclease